MEFPIDRQPFPLLPHVDHGYLGGLVPALFAHRFLGSKQKLCRGILACSGAPACRWSRSILRKSGSTHNGKQYTIAKAIAGRADRSFGNGALRDETFAVEPMWSPLGLVRLPDGLFAL